MTPTINATRNTLLNVLFHWFCTHSIGLNLASLAIKKEWKAHKFTGSLNSICDCFILWIEYSQRFLRYFSIYFVIKAIVKAMVKAIVNKAHWMHVAFLFISCVCASNDEGYSFWKNPSDINHFNALYVSCFRNQTFFFWQKGKKFFN